MARAKVFLGLGTGLKKTNKSIFVCVCVCVCVLIFRAKYFQEDTLQTVHSIRLQI